MPTIVDFPTRLLLDSEVVIGQFLRNSLFLQAFYEGRDRGGIFGKSRLISSAYVLSMMWKTPESNKSLSPFVAGRRRGTGARGGLLQRASWHQRGAATARRGVTPAPVCMPPTCDTLSDVLMVSPLGVSCCSPQKEVVCRTTTSMPTVM